MKILIAAPTGFNAREILLPLREVLTADTAIKEVQVVTPAAEHHQHFFADFSDKFSWHNNPVDQAGHDQLIAQLKPNIIVTPTIGLDTRDTPLLRAGNRADIPTLTFIASWDNVYKMARLKEHGHSGASKAAGGDYELPSYYAVWNKMNNNHLLEVFPSIDPDHVTIVGSPRFDYFTHHDRIPTKDQLLTYLDFANPHTTDALLHYATTELYPFEYIIQAVHRAATEKHIPYPVVMYASVHPGGDITRHQQYQKYGVKVRYSFGRRDRSPVPEFSYLPTSQEIYMLVALFKHTNILINQSSTVAIESMAADTPVINVKYGQSLDWWRWYRSMVYRDFQQHYRYITRGNGTTVVKNKKQLIAAINTYLENPSLKKNEREKTLQKMITHTDGSASQRLLNWIKQCAA